MEELQTQITSLIDKINVLEKKVDDLSKRTISPDSIIALGNILSQIACERIKKIIDEKKSISIDEVEKTLVKLGFNLKNRQVADTLITEIPPWKESIHIEAPLNQVTYENTRIIVPYNGKNIDVPSTLLPIDIGQALELVKDIFKGIIEVDYQCEKKFIWDAVLEKLTINLVQNADIVVTIDDDTIGNFKKLTTAFATLIKKFEAPKAAVILVRLFGGPSGPGPRVYDPRFVQLLDSKSTKSFMTSIDFWFEIQGLLIWERPEYSAATYIFSMPEGDVRFFILRAYSSTLYAIRHDPSSGFKAAINHNYNDIDQWEYNFDFLIDETK